MIKFTAPEDRIIQFRQSKVINGVTVQVTNGVTETETLILKLLAEDPAYSFSELALKSGISRKTIAARIKTLKEKGIIKRVGTNKKGYWEIFLRR